ncbi:MAG: hypothetical protein QOF50_407, partial [Gaiellaceae bacterium]|nr:hypothetical protein [Gaiellaceae bacterium]
MPIIQTQTIGTGMLESAPATSW